MKLDDLTPTEQYGLEILYLGRHAVKRETFAKKVNLPLGEAVAVAESLRDKGLVIEDVSPGRSGSPVTYRVSDGGRDVMGPEMRARGVDTMSRRIR